MNRRDALKALAALPAVGMGITNAIPNPDEFLEQYNRIVMGEVVNSTDGVLVPAEFCEAFASRKTIYGKTFVIPCGSNATIEDCLKERGII